MLKGAGTARAESRLRSHLGARAEARMCRKQPGVDAARATFLRARIVAVDARSRRYDRVYRSCMACMHAGQPGQPNTCTLQSLEGVLEKKSIVPAPTAYHECSRDRALPAQSTLRQLIINDVARTFDEPQPTGSEVARFLLTPEPAAHSVPRQYSPTVLFLGDFSYI